MPDVLALVGSLRAASYNLALARAAQDAAPPALRLHLADLGGIPVFSEDLEALGLPAPVLVLADRILAADVLLITTPEYNFSIPGGLKNALDWLSGTRGNRCAAVPRPSPAPPSHRRHPPGPVRRPARAAWPGRALPPAAATGNLPGKPALRQGRPAHRPRHPQRPRPIRHPR